MTATKGGRQRRERIKVSLFACLSQCLRPKLSSPMPPRFSAVGCPIKGGRQTVSSAKKKENNCKENVVVIILEDSAITISRRELLLRRQCIRTKPCCVSGPVGKHLFPSLCKHVCIPSVFPLLSSLWRPADPLISHIYPIITCCSSSMCPCDAQDRRDLYTGAFAADVDFIFSFLSAEVERVRAKKPAPELLLAPGSDCWSDNRRAEPEVIESQRCAAGQTPIAS